PLAGLGGDRAEVAALLLGQGMAAHFFVVEDLARLGGGGRVFALRGVLAHGGRLSLAHPGKGAAGGHDAAQAGTEGARDVTDRADRRFRLVRDAVAVGARRPEPAPL